MRRDRVGLILALTLILAILALLALVARAHQVTAARAAFGDRCGALTLRGLPCRNPVRLGRCWRHRVLAPRVVVLDRT